MSDDYLVRHCAPTLAGIKTGSIFSCPYESKDALLHMVRGLNKRLASKGLLQHGCDTVSCEKCIVQLVKRLAGFGCTRRSCHRGCLCHRTQHQPPKPTVR